MPGPTRKRSRRGKPANQRRERPSPARAEPAGARSGDAPRVVGMGASAGGLEALQSFFARLPPHTGLAFVLVPHLSPQRPSMMADLLARSTAMEVCEATDRVALEGNCVYVAPPGAELVLSGTQLRVRRVGASGHPSRPVDTFLQSLAAEQGEDAIGIIFSGTGTDGTLGFRAIKEHGGLTLVQDVRSAQHAGMPHSAIASGMADYVRPVAGLARVLLDLVGRSGRRRGEGARGPAGDIVTRLPTIFSLLSGVTGHQFSRYRQPTIIRRVNRHMRLLGIERAADYVARLRQDEEEVRRLFRDLLIGVTHFFRDPESFAALANKGIGPLLSRRSEETPLRVWVPGCSSGEEAYSIAMLIDEQMAATGRRLPMQIFASDIDEGQLKRARAGVYPTSIDGDVGPERLARYFVREGDAYHVAKRIREAMVFSVHNLLSDPPFSKIDLISCRNLLIYLDTDLQRRLLPLFHRVLNPGGLLFLGAAETVNGFTGLFAAVDRRAKLFRRRDAAGIRTMLPPLTPAGRPTGAWPAEGTIGERTAIGALVQRKLLGRYAPPCVLIDDKWDVVRFHGHTGRFLEAPEGPPSHNVLRMVRPALRLALREMLREAAAGDRTVAHRRLAVRSGNDVGEVELTIEPVEQHGQRYFMVVFEERARGDDAAPEVGAGPARRSATLDDLYRELATTREDLQATIQELETSNEQLRGSNEELSSMNEELQSANEELETSKEELQAVTEELETVNAELNVKVEELRRANSDFQNLLTSTQIPTIFLGADLRVRLFTPPSVQVFGLIAGDIGRPITDIAQRFEHADLTGDLRDVLRSREPREREVRTRTGQWCIMRILPYRSGDEVGDGIVLTFVDITDRKQSEYELRLLLRELDHRVKNTLAAVQSIAEQSASSARSLPDFVDSFRARIDALARLHALLSGRESRTLGLRKLVETTVASFCRDSDTLSVEAEDTPLPSATARSLGMALNELAQNALKYGALSRGGGRVTISSEPVAAPEGRGLRIVWAESGGPPVPAPSRRGFGSVLIEEAIPYELGGTVKLEFPGDGVRCEIEIPSSQLVGES